MNKEELLITGYKKYNQPEGEPILYQKRIDDEKGIKYFINCYHYNSFGMDSWEFKLGTESKFGTVKTTLFNTKKKTIKQIEVFMECIWGNYGAKYYEEFVLSNEEEVKDVN